MRRLCLAMRLYLTGFMGAGKTSVGGNLSDLLGYFWLDLDQEIEARAGLEVREIFEKRGETAFRDLEHACLKETARLEDVVVATGGGTMAFPRNVAEIRRLGLSVWLNPSFDTIVGRISAPGRPLFQGEQQARRPLFQSEQQARELFQQRLPAYRKSDMTMDVELHEAASDVAARIVRRLREQHCVI